MSKLAIQAETEDDRYDTTTTVICYECQSSEVGKEAERLQPVVDGILKSLSFSRKEEIKAWEQEFVPCEHTLCLVQEENKAIDPSGMTSECPDNFSF
jgi:ubiquitin carboxyl-terminal hydrolase 5/13